ncbi:sulfotransferase family protein [Nitzschia inconspicua]|uniref:Sulfotransferase family protein n=1 Tax=Nitzschia inconspicua TaxID=303405 RepID=A0A9K3M5K6_9STRA|nr:sulfotransferase family protein [Nitzschia inconspicua]
MPWLEKDKLLFVHVPRCSGTSLMKHNKVPEKAIEDKTSLKKFWLKTFFRRYALLEQSNFPVWTESNAACLFIFVIGSFLLQIQDIDYRALAISMMCGSLIFSVFLTFVFVAPTICRIRPIRRWYLVFVHYILCRWMECLEYITGCNKHGYLNHLTAKKMLDYGYVSTEVMSTVPSLAIVRNPYARMVSLYMYNRFGPAEPFKHFVRTWYNCTFKAYRETGEMEDWYTPCHAIPQFEYTHDNGGKNQLVKSIVKQEQLKYLKYVKNDNTSFSDDSSSDGGDNIQDPKNFTTIRDLPDRVRDALLGMPHENMRKKSAPWYDYYDQETLNMVYEMYHKDFEVFNYSPKLDQRPDLQLPDALSLQTAHSP